MISVYCIAWDGLSFVELKNGRLWGYVETLYQVAALLFPELSGKIPKRIDLRIENGF
jgi:hypothetical protein